MDESTEWMCILRDSRHTSNSHVLEQNKKLVKKARFLEPIAPSAGWENKKT
jgi:hypothetical protein